MLTGILHDGSRIDAIPLCEFESDHPDTLGRVTSCDRESRYRVTFEDGTVMTACEEHAQRLWDGEPGRDLRVLPASGEPVAE